MPDHDSKYSLTTAIAIPTYLRERVLLDTCRQVLALDPPADEILVIDQTPQHEPETESYLTEQMATGRIKWIRHSPPNLPAARNRALAETNCDVIIFIDDDVELPTQFVEKHRRNYARSEICGVAGRIVVPSGPLPRCVRRTWPRIMDHRFFSLESNVRSEGVACFIGCNHSVRTAFLKSIGGYDENYIGWAYREDSDMAIRIWKAGGKIVFDPDTVLTHLAVPSGGCRLKPSKRSLPEWKVSFPATYFALRHLFPRRWFWYDLLLGNVRRYVLRKDNVFYPHRIPWAFVSYFFSIYIAARLSLRSNYHEFREKVS